MHFLRETVVILLFLFGYCLATGWVPGAYPKFFTYRITFIYYLIAFTVTWFLDQNLVAILCMLYYWIWILLYSIDLLGKRRSQNLVLIGLYEGSYRYEYANYALGPDNANAERVAIAGDDVMRFCWLPPVTEHDYVTICFKSSNNRYTCIAWRDFFGVKGFREFFTAVLSIFDRLIWFGFIFVLQNSAYIFYGIFCVLCFYLRKFMPATKSVGVVVTILLVILASANLGFALYLMMGGDIFVLQYLWETLSKR